jgi:hypothetical protein
VATVSNAKKTRGVATGEGAGTTTVSGTALGITATTTITVP